jgi:vacuolar-type H+-ATPase subunit E/Vma4
VPESLESFVRKLQTEGVEAGKDAAEKIKKEANREAERILADAKADAEKITAKAASDAERQLSRAKKELELAVRDAILRLGESLGRVLSVMLARRVEKKLSEPDYMGKVVREIIIAYAKADARQEPQIEINIQKKMRDKMHSSALKDLFRNLHGDQDKLDLKYTLSKAGFEYKIHGATVEVSPDSISELISEMVNPDLHEIIADVVGKMNEKSSNETPGKDGNRKDHSCPDGSRDREGTQKGEKR